MSSLIHQQPTVASPAATAAYATFELKMYVIVGCCVLVMLSVAVALKFVVAAPQTKFLDEDDEDEALMESRDTVPSKLNSAQLNQQDSLLEAVASAEPHSSLDRASPSSESMDIEPNIDICAPVVESRGLRNRRPFGSSESYATTSSLHQPLDSSSETEWEIVSPVCNSPRFEALR